MKSMEKSNITAVEWLIQEINPFLNMPIEDLYKTILQAKQMEKEQSEKSYDDGIIEGKRRNNNNSYHSFL